MCKLGKVMLLVGGLVIAMGGYVFADVLGNIPIEPTGWWKISNITVAIGHHGKDWHYTDQRESQIVTSISEPVSEDNKWSLEGTFKTKKGGVFSFNEIISKEKKGYKYECNMTANEDIITNVLSLQFYLSISRFKNSNIVLDENQEVLLPSELDKGILENREVESITLSLDKNKKLYITGPVKVAIIDNRAYNTNSDSYILRLYFSPGSGFKKDETANLQFNFDVK